ncbi:MAG TPA: OmcA/MtrC family decaheme c-type cytochrome [Burkholderiaceae bacterium]|nr:OmcA/MtrC family decaheme c-type cytochrome [Burkholderiaceae bacterium]
MTIASPPVVNFKLATAQGVPVVGFGNQAKCFPRNNTTTPYEKPCYPNLAFTIAKLQPGSGGTPSKWVNYIVVAPATVTGTTVNPRTTLSTPSTENVGALVDHGDGTYTYTFYNDVPGMAALVAGITAPAGSNKADLGDVSYNKDATHRLAIQISGSAPGTGSNNPTGLSTGYPAAVSFARPVDLIYDFVPATGQAPAASANRKMVANSNCESCHSTLGGLPGGDGSSLDFHGGGRNNIEYCVTCHTDQRRYGQVETPVCPQPSGKSCYDTATRTFLKNGASATSTYVVDNRTVGNVMNFIHKVHVAKIMTKTGYNYGGVAFDGGYSQDIRNCDKCHDSTGASTGGTPLPQAALWKTEANRLACGSCHDGINFDTGQGITLAGETTGPFTNNAVHPANAVDGTCLNSSCHNPGAGADPDLVHKPITPPNAKNSLQVPTSTDTTSPADGNSNTNAGWIASNQSRLPPGAKKVEYEIQTVQLANGAARNPQIIFRIKLDGVVTPLLDNATAPTNAVTGQKEIFAGYMGAPSVQFVWAVPQDGIAKPADFNVSASSYLRSLWNGTATGSSAGTLTGPDPNGGWYTATLTGAKVATNAVMFTGGLGYSYNARSSLPLTQTDVPGYPATLSTIPVTGNSSTGLIAGMPNAYGGMIVIAKNTQKVGTGFTGRRQIVEDARCNACHQELGAFTEDAFHAGQRNDGTTCSWCHTPNRNSSGWTADSVQIMHGIHGADKRGAANQYKWHATCPSTATTLDQCEGFWEIVYPGVLARCEQCHVPGSYDFSNSASADAAGLSDGVNKRQYKYITGTMASTLPGTLSLSPYVTAGTNYGAAFGYNVTTNVTTLPADTTLIQSPTVAACAGCHTSPLAISHMQVNGGRFYEARTTQFATGADTPSGTATTEQCMVCHSSGRIADTKVVHNP